jgi:hypothetical protein
MDQVSAGAAAESNAMGGSHLDSINDQIPDLFASSGYGDSTILDDLLQQNNGIGPWENFNWMDSMASNQGPMDDSLFGLFTPGPPPFQAFESNI